MELRGVSKQFSLAADIGVDQSTVSRWGNGGTLSLKNAVKFCEALDISLDWLLLGRGDMEQHKLRTVSRSEWDLVLRVRALHPKVAESLCHHIQLLSSALDYGTELQADPDPAPAGEERHRQLVYAEECDD